MYEKVFDFTEARKAGAINKGRTPRAGLVQGRDGNFYGTTEAGGGAGRGTVFKMTPAGVLTTLVELGAGGESLGTDPSATLLLGSDGNFYGTTYRGGVNNAGTVFKMSQAGVLTTLVEFTGNGAANKGRFPNGALLQGSDGNLYGTTYRGGANEAGTAFKMTPSGVLTTLVEFTGNGVLNKGRDVYAGLVEGSDGHFYGTTSAGGASNAGTVFKMTSAGVLTTLVEFTGNGASNKGRFPASVLLLGSDGNFYGTTAEGGADGFGTVFKMTAAGVLTTLVEFTGNGAANKGARPHGGLMQGSDGNFYGTTAEGGANGFGTVFRMLPAGPLTTLVEFTEFGPPNKGRSPYAALVQGSDGNFFGTTLDGGADGYGTIFKLSPMGVMTTLVEFTGDAATNLSRRPAADLVQTSDGNFFGTTLNGGANDRGTVFKMTPGGGVTTLVEFTGNGDSNKGASPSAGLVDGGDGNLYGTTFAGGANDLGTVFKMTPEGELTTLVEFTGNGASNKGSKPFSPLIRTDDGIFYGSTYSGGKNDHGTVFRMTPQGILTTLVEFTGNGTANKGSSPRGLLVQGEDRAFYGTTVSGGARGFGTVFKVTPEGVLTTLVEFTGNGVSNKGSSPHAGLTQGSDGNFYGTTYSGGASGRGTVFQMTPVGVLTTLVEFTGDGASNRGSFPESTFHLGGDGNLYGTTSLGGADNSGTVFRISPGGSLTTVREFFLDLDGGNPEGNPIVAADGNLYGTTSRPDGVIYRLILPGVPTVAAGNVTHQGGASAVIEAQVNARGSNTEASLEYGTDGVAFPNTVPLAVGLNGFQTKRVGVTLSGLTPAQTYFYRIRAASSAGVTVTPVYRFFTVAEPVVATASPSEIAPTSARFNGTVNARNFDTAVVFEYGTDGDSFPFSAPAEPAVVTGDIGIVVSAAVAGLQKGTTYHYRIKATNAGGTAVSGVRSFVTPIEPVATVGAALALTTTSAKVSGSVIARDSATEVAFEYGTDGVSFPNSVAASPVTVVGSDETDVTALLTNLSQGTTYHYRIRAVSAGGVTLSPVASFQLAVLSGFTQVFPDTAPGAQGFIVINLSPAGVGGWRFVGEQQWRASGIPAGALTTGDREIEFRPVAGYLQPLRETVSIISGGAATVLDREYYETNEATVGGLSVILKPEAITEPGLPVAQRAQWRLLGEDDTQWRESGATIPGLLVGNYLVECKPIEGRTTPPAISAAVFEGQTSTATATYFLADATIGAPPAALPFEVVSGDETQPYAFTGQIRSNIGAATGFVVKPRVVATAGHVVFDDGTLSATAGLQWLFQRDRGTFEPKPQIPRGFYVFDGYAAQRAAENTPGESSPESQNLDAAALYFLEDAGRGGYGGFLASDATENEWIISDRLKTLVGYPLDGTPAGNKGRMHATPAANVPFSQGFGRTYATSAITSSGGNSGGPLCVQFDDGKYFPAAIYLGGSSRTVVRAIDSDVIDLFNRGEVSANGGDNNTSGGISHVNAPLAGGAFAPAAIKVNITPITAVNSGARWRLGTNGQTRASGVQLSSLSPGNYTVHFTPIPGFTTPGPVNVTITAGAVQMISRAYTAEITIPTITSASSVRAIRGQAFTFDLKGTDQPTRFQASGLAGTGLTLNESSGRISGTPEMNGTIILSVTARNAAGTSDPVTLTIVVSDAGELIVEADPTRGTVKVKPKRSGNIYAQGERMTLIAKASTPAFLFGGWVLEGAVPSSLNDATTSFEMSQLVVARASFVANPFLIRKGNYTGRIAPESDVTVANTGTLTLALNKLGHFTGKLQLGRKTFRLKGSLGPDGTGEVRIKRNGLELMVLNLALDLTGGTERIAGTLTVDGTALIVAVDRALFDSAIQPIGAFTLVLPRDVTNPVSTVSQGNGFGRVKVKRNGIVSFTGTLGDGTPVTQSARVSKTGSWPFHALLYKKRGVLTGELTFRNVPGNSDIDGVLEWIKPPSSSNKVTYPAGFTTRIDAIGSRYDKGDPVPFDSGTVSFGGGELGVIPQVAVSIDSRNRVTAPDVNGFTLEVSTGSGLLKGTFLDGKSTKTRKFRGAIFQIRSEGYGYFPGLPLPDGGKSTGFVELNATP